MPMSKDQRNFEGVGWTKKPVSYEEIDSSIGSTHPELKGLKKYRDTDILSVRSFLLSDFTKEMPQYFIMIGSNNKKYLVDTQGFNYPRYMVRII